MLYGQNIGRRECGFSGQCHTLNVLKIFQGGVNSIYTHCTVPNKAGHKSEDNAWQLLVLPKNIGSTKKVNRIESVRGNKIGEQMIPPRMLPKDIGATNQLLFFINDVRKVGRGISLLQQFFSHPDDAF